MHNSRSRTSARPVINVTPLIDVLLVLLIIFMIISPVRPSKFEARIPEQPDPGEEVVSDLSLVVSINMDGSYALNSQPAGTLEELEELLHYALDGRPADRKAVFLKAPPTLKYGEAVKTIDIMKASGASPIGLQTE